MEFSSQVIIMECKLRRCKDQASLEPLDDCETMYREVFLFPPKTKANIGPHKSNLSVAIIGIDSMSRSNFIRQMRKTKEFIESTTLHVNMLGYHSVGHNTQENIVPLLTGMSGDKKQRNCLKTNPNASSECLILWDLYKKHGFDIAFAENTKNDKNDITKHLKGTYPFDSDHTPLLRKLRGYFGCPWPPGCGLNACIGSKNEHQFQLDWTSLILNQEGPLFLCSWLTKFNHDILNSGPIIDKDTANFFKNIRSRFNDTIILFMSDHGFRTGIRTTFIGRMEGYLPFMYVLSDTSMVQK